MAEVNYDKISFRQIGRDIGSGRLYRGATKNAYTKTEAASIPSKFETILHVDARSLKGFGTQSNRFGGQFDNDNPGPGAYRAPGSLKVQSDSYSKRGFGNLASKADRFTDQQKQVYYQTNPGPGAYGSQERTAHRSQSGARQASKTSHYFAKPTSVSLVKKKETPSVGQYEYVNPRDIHKPKVVGSSHMFKSGTDRLDQQKTDETPGPGKYEPAELQHSKSQEMSAFKPSVGGKRMQINLYDPHQTPEDDNTPGPGAYNSHITAANAHLLGHPGSSMFAVSDVDRFGKAKRARKSKHATPGPGTYSRGYDDSIEKVPVSGSVFMSESDRNPFNMKKGTAPGPAFYKNIKGRKKKSFHLNINKQWV